MKVSKPEISTQFIVDKAGKRTGVIIDIITYNKLLEEIEDLYLSALGQKELKSKQEVISHEELKKELSEKK